MNFLQKKKKNNDKTVQEDKLRDMLSKQSSMMKEEFDKFRNDMDLAYKRHIENLTDKLNCYQRDVGKLEKAKEKTERDCKKMSCAIQVSSSPIIISYYCLFLLCIITTILICCTLTFFLEERR